MPTVEGFLDEWDWLLNPTKHPWAVRYGWTNRCNPWEAPHMMDCSGSGSGIINVLLVREGRQGFPCMGSFAMSRRAHRLGLGCSRETARRTPGSMAFIGANEGQGMLDGSKDGVWNGHVGYGYNYDLTVQARGHRAGCGRWPWEDNLWQWYSLPFPELTSDVVVSKPRIEIASPPEEPMDILLMPATKFTQPRGVIATAQAIGPPFNFVQLRGGARVIGSHQINGDPLVGFWEPPDKSKIPDWEIIGSFLIPKGSSTQYGLKEEPHGYLAAEYILPSQQTVTYATPVARPL